jgi:hypothetical protein
MAGIIQGECHFYKKQMTLSGIQNNMDLLVRLQQRLGHGTIKKPYGSNALRLVVANQAGLKRYLTLTKCKWVGPYKRD